MASHPSDGAQIFDRRLLRRRRDRAAARFQEHNFLVGEVAGQMVERLSEIDRRFTRVLDLGCHRGEAARALKKALKPDLLVQADLSPAMLGGRGGFRVAADEEFLPFAGGAFDLVVSALSLHWVNDLPGALLQINHCLKPDGLFLGALIGGGTLGELRRILTEAELALEGGASPRVSPFVDVRDAGTLLQRAGFALPVADTSTITASYKTALALMQDLRGMGETNLLVARRKTFSRRKTLFAAAAAYDERCAIGTAGKDGVEDRVSATFDIITLTGWHPDPSQPQPARRGSATASLANALGTVEKSAGEKPES